MRWIHVIVEDKLKSAEIERLKIKGQRTEMEILNVRRKKHEFSLVLCIKRAKESLETTVISMERPQWVTLMYSKVPLVWVNTQSMIWTCVIAKGWLHFLKGRKNKSLTDLLLYPLLGKSTGTLNDLNKYVSIRTFTLDCSGLTRQSY